MKAEDLDYRPTKYIDPNSLSDFIKTNMPNYVNQLKENQIKTFSIRSVFNYELKIWMPKQYKLPYLYLEENGDFIILTPLDILTKDDSIINNTEFYSNFTSVANSSSCKDGYSRSSFSNV